MTSALAILGITASIIGIIAFFNPALGPRLLTYRPMTARFDWDRVLAKVEQANHRVLLLQTWFPTLRTELPRWAKAISKESLDFRVLIADQRLVPFRLKARESVSGLTIQNVSDIKGFISAIHNEHRGRFKARFFSSIPFGPVYVIDDEVYWGIYLAHTDSMVGPCFRTRSKSRLGKLILESYESLWQHSTSRSGVLSLNDRPANIRANHTDETTEFRYIRARLCESFRLSTSLTASDMKYGRFVCFIRHGQTDLNLSNIITGSLDVGINALARDKINIARDQLRGIKWSRILSSPNRRCTETLISLMSTERDRIEVREELRERSMGDLEGFSRDEFKGSLAQYDGQDVFNAFHLAPTGGEAYCDVVSRTYDFLWGTILVNHPEMPILICTHDTTLRSLHYLLCNIDEKDVSNIEIPFVQPLYLIYK